MARTVSQRDLRAWSPFIVLAGAIVALALSLTVYSIEAPTAPLLSRIYAALDMFTGAYIPLIGQSATPSAAIATAGIAALLVTFLAAFAALYELSTKAREWFQARRAGSDLIVIGSGEAAAEILRAHPTSTGRELLLITGDEAGRAAITAAGIAPRIVTDLDAFATSTGLLALTRRADRVAVATDDDGLNLCIADAITKQATPRQKVMALIADPKLADERRPSVIDGELPDRFGINCPTENIAEEVCHQIDLLALSDHVIDGTDAVAVYLDLDDSDLAKTVALWVRRHSWSRGYLLNDASQKRLPRLELVVLQPGFVVADPAILNLPRVRIVALADPGDSARQTLWALRHDQEDSNTRPVSYIAVTTSHLIGENVTRASRIAVVDPTVAAWDDVLIFDDIADQWGRAFNQAYNAIYGMNLSWLDVRHKREGQSSRLAALHMLSVLKQHGYQLVKTVGDARPRNPEFPPECEQAMAEMEHKDWLVRQYTKPDGTRAAVAGERDLKETDWANLTEDDKEKNLRLIRHTYPGMAALFGYQIQLSPTDA
jgi:hypothetical protein